MLAGQTTLIDAMALIAAARGVVSNDSGLMHVAAAFGIPQVAVFGSTSPEHTPPLNDKARVLWLKEELQLDCAPCFERVCRFGHTRCLTGVAAGARAGRARQRARASMDGDASQLMHEALVGAGTSVWAWDMDNDVLTGMSGSVSLLGYAEGELESTQAGWNTVIHPDDLAENDAAYLRHARGETPAYESEYRARAKDGSWRWLAERGRIVEWWPDGRPRRMVGTLSDVTQRRQAESDTAERDERLRQITRHVPGLLYQFRLLQRRARCVPLRQRTLPRRAGPRARGADERRLRAVQPHRPRPTASA